jgi:hypothetical protein
LILERKEVFHDEEGTFKRWNRGYSKEINFERSGPPDAVLQ